MVPTEDEIYQRCADVVRNLIRHYTAHPCEANKMVAYALENAANAVEQDKSTYLAARSQARSLREDS